MKKAFSAIIIFFILIGGSNAQGSDRQQLWDKEIKIFAEIDREVPPPENAILFIGDSSIRMWTNLRASFPRLKVINRSLDGSRLEDINFYFDKIVAPYKPKIIVLYAGETDLTEGVAPEKILENYKIFEALVKERLPQTQILFVSLKPSPANWRAADKYKQTNALIKTEIEKGRQAQFVDIFTPMLDEKGEPKAEIFREDRLNLNEKGYILWRKILHNYLH
jgi:lysophospholipase L1-like esterase